MSIQIGPEWLRGNLHDFYHSWIAEIKRTLNRRIATQRVISHSPNRSPGNLGPDVLTLSRPVFGSLSPESRPSDGGVAVADAPPKTRYHARTEVDIYASKAKSVVIRHRSGHKVIAMIEIVSPGNKNGQTEMKAFVQKADQAL